MHNRRRWQSALLGAMAIAACTTSVRRPALHQPGNPGGLAATHPTIKVHHRSGDVYVLSSWSMDGDSVLAGRGARYGMSRDAASAADVRLPVDSIALLETNDKASVTSFGMGLLNVWTVVWGATTLACVMDPKACFGSCPTFYLDDVDRDRPLAEGFSSSIARSLEATDFDDLGQRRPGGARVDIRMTNEAWETHAVRHVRLRAVPVRDGDQVFATADGAFFAARALAPASTCRSATGDCRTQLAARDAAEWTDVTSATDLAAPDTMTLVFPPSNEAVGLVLGARQSFVSTFVLYQTMAYLGRNAGAWLASLERGDSAALKPLAAVNTLMGEIAVDVEDGGTWRRAGTFAEAGPIAVDVQMIPIQRAHQTDSVRVRLTFAKGSWRIGYAALARLSEPINAVTLDPVVARKIGRDARDVGALLGNPKTYLYSYPDDEFKLSFDLPRDAASYALFLDARGYYYEWMRGEWLADEDPMIAAMLLLNPRAALRQMAPQFKPREATFEHNFLNSRFGRK